MPFVTEALWAALPHRATRPGPAHRRPLARRRRRGTRPSEREVGALIDLVTEIRNARASAKLPAADWLETLVFVPTDLGPTLRGAPAGHRTARPGPPAPSRADARRRSAAATRPGDLAVIVARRRDRGDDPAGDRRARDADALERARLERELAEAEGWLAAARERLANDAFVSRAPAAVVDGARAREAELADQVDRLRDRLGR